MRKTLGITERCSGTLPFATPYWRPSASCGWGSGGGRRPRKAILLGPARGPRDAAWGRGSAPGAARLARPRMAEQRLAKFGV